ncbi:response regulator transcription factor [Lentibacillus saliphilus]|uniref:response regulator transcription factor n=1 Tax=Lentibacillus saliphilus TaxID=2737028 RepID=UPI001C2F4BF4|nr:response regulator transcription factor [Lentibacillus saliphilus]
MIKETILVVDDEAGIRELMQLNLENKGYRVLTARNGDQALRLATLENPDLIILDIEMPGQSGFEVCQQLRREMTVPIIFLSVRREVIDKVKCFELGGDDYITKPFDYTELEARIRANLRRYQQFESEKNLLEYDELTIDLDQYQCYLNGEPVTLSAKEMQLLVQLAKHPNQIWSAEQLYDHIWGFDSVGELQTVKVHISHLRRKLEKDPTNPKYIRTVRGFGYLFSS